MPLLRNDRGSALISYLKPSSVASSSSYTTLQLFRIYSALARAHQSVVSITPGVEIMGVLYITSIEIYSDSESI